MVNSPVVIFLGTVAGGDPPLLAEHHNFIIVHIPVAVELKVSNAAFLVLE